jgi:hypothetical protein
MQTMQHDQEISEGISCPLCHQTSHEILYRVNSRTTAEHMFHFGGSVENIRHLMQIIESLWGKDSARMLQCNNCQLVFADPFLAGSGEFYSAVYQKASYYPEWKWDYEITYQDLNAEHLRQNNLENARLLEIGAGNGAFVKKLADGIFSKENLLCTEYSEYGAGQINGLGIKCISEPVHVLKTGQNEGRFHFICMFQVLEHMDNLDALFETLNHLALEGTVLYITVPADGYRAFYDRLGRHLDVPPNHVTRWNPNSLVKLGEKFGWRLTERCIQEMPYNEKLKRLIFDRLEYHAVFRSANWTKRKMPLIRKLGLAIAAGIMVLAYPGAVFRLWNKKLGISQWVKFVKE